MNLWKHQKAFLFHRFENIYLEKQVYLQLATTQKIVSIFKYFIPYMRRVLLHRCETIKLQGEDIILRGYENVS